MTWMAGQSTLSASFQRTPNMYVEGVVNALEDRTAIEKDPDLLEKYADRNLVKSNKSECKKSAPEEE